MTFAPATVQDMLDRALETCSAALSERDVQVNLHALPPVMADADFVTKVLTNLLENATKYSPAHSPIFISAERRGEMVSVSVADRGYGVDPSEQALIFERFYRAGAQSQQTSGTGMGLAISRAIIEAHRGALTVTSQLGEGSVFSFTLPIARASSSP
jgi:two-component system sensor histidine kinase KdpD